MISPKETNSQSEAKSLEENDLRSHLIAHVLQQYSTADQLRSAVEMDDEQLVKLFEYDKIVQLVENSNNVTTIGNVEGDVHVQSNLTEAQAADLIRQGIGSALQKLSEQSDYSLLQLESVKTDIAIEARVGRRRFTLATIAIVSVVLALAFLVFTKIVEFTPPPLHRMNSDLNIAFADFTVIDSFPDGAVQNNEIGLGIADELFEEFKNNDNVTLTRDDLDNRSATCKLGDITIEITRYNSSQAYSDPEQAAQSLTKPEHANAHIVIYGYFDTSTGQVIPRFYVSPYLVGAEELTGSSAFGSTITTRHTDPRSPISRTELNTILEPRALALTEFMLGLASYRVALAYPDSPQIFLESTIKHFLNALGETNEDNGLEIIYSWIGAALRQQAYAADYQDFNCPLDGPEDIDIWGCARRAHEIALELASAPYARAYIGLGNIWLDQARLAGSTECTLIPNAIEEYEQARDILLGTSETVANLYVEMTLYWDIGHAHSQGYLNSRCQTLYERLGIETYGPAVENLTHVTDLYIENEDVSIAKDLGTRAYYQLGLIHEFSGDFSNALDAYRNVIDIATPEDALSGSYSVEEPWQSIRWLAWTRIGHVRSMLAEHGAQNSSWEAAIAAFEESISYYQRQNNCEREAVNHLGEALLYAGKAYIQLENTEQANSYFREIQLIGERCPNTLSTKLLEEVAALISP